MHSPRVASICSASVLPSVLSQNSVAGHSLSSRHAWHRRGLPLHTCPVSHSLRVSQVRTHTRSAHAYSFPSSGQSETVSHPGAHNRSLRSQMRPDEHPSLLRQPRRHCLRPSVARGSQMSPARQSLSLSHGGFTTHRCSASEQMYSLPSSTCCSNPAQCVSFAQSPVYWQADGC